MSDPINTEVTKFGQYRIGTTRIASDGTRTFSSSNQKLSAALYFHKKSAVVGGDRFNPTRYGHLRAQYGCGVTYSARLKFRNYTLISSGSGPNATYFRSLLDNDPEGFFNLVTTSSRFMSIPTPYFKKAEADLLDTLDNQSVSIGTFIGELGESVSYVSSRAILLGKFALSIATGNYQGALKQIGISKRRWTKFRKKSIRSATTSVTHQLASNWLELSFAIKPLVNDIKSFSELYSSPDRVLKNLSARATGRESIDNRVHVKTFEGKDIKHHYQGRSTVSVCYSVSNPEVVAQKALGVYNKSSILWEVTPFSWLIDYVVDVGGFISRLTATDGLIFRHGYRSVKVQRTSECKHDDRRDYNSSSLRGYEIYTRKGACLVEGYWREPMYSFPRPQLNFSLPDLSLRQASYATSLAILLSSK
jgi:hypothetical protein